MSCKLCGDTGMRTCPYCKGKRRVTGRRWAQDCNVCFKTGEVTCECQIVPEVVVRLVAPFFCCPGSFMVYLNVAASIGGIFMRRPSLWYHGDCIIHLHSEAVTEVRSAVKVDNNTVVIDQGSVYLYERVLIGFSRMRDRSEKSFVLRRDIIQRMATFDGRGIWPDQLQFRFGEERQMSKRTQLTDEVFQAPCTIKLAPEAVEGVRKKISGVLENAHLRFDRDHGLIHIVSGELRIVPSGGLICFLGSGEERKSFGLWRDDFKAVVDAEGKTVWPKPK